MRILRTKTFLKSFVKLNKKVQQKAEERLVVFLQNPSDPVLRLHELKGMCRGVYSINVTGDYRILFRYVQDDVLEIIALLDIGTHAELYG